MLFLTKFNIVSPGAKEKMFKGTSGATAHTIAKKIPRKRIPVARRTQHATLAVFTCWDSSVVLPNKKCATQCFCIYHSKM